jgi:glutamyl-tRNA reductase
MSSLAVATAARHGAGPIVISNRTNRSAMRLAAKFGAGVASLADLPAQLAIADLVIACTGAAGHVISAAATAQALQTRGPGRPLVLLDLALPRDVEPEAGRLPGVALIDLEAIAATGADGQVPHGLAGPVGGIDVAAVRLIVATELSAYLQADRAARVAPTVVALRAKAATVVESELARLERRLGELDSRSRREIAQSMGRIADKLLHGPTVRIKELAGSPGADAYEVALRVLFELDPDVVQAVASPDADKLARPVQEGSE